jgi:hypothetical protein
MFYIPLDILTIRLQTVEQGKSDFETSQLEQCKSWPVTINNKTLIVIIQQSHII